MNLLKDYVTDIRNEFRGYNGKRFSKDLMAGITVAAVALPLALAFGVSSGATAAAGLVTAIIGGIIISIFSEVSVSDIRTDRGNDRDTGNARSEIRDAGNTDSMFFAGIILILAGILKLGRMIYYIPSSVITGFTSGIAIIIALGQLDNFFGVTSHGSLAITKFISYFTQGFHPDIPTMCIGLAVIIIMVIWPKKLNDKVPSSLAALIIVLIANHFLKLDVAMVGDIPKSLFLDDRLSIAGIDFAKFWDLFVPALSIAALGMIRESARGASAGKMKKEELNADRELIAQGIGNIVIPFFGGVPATAAIARTSVAIKAGCETRLTGIIHAGILLLSMFVLAPVMSVIPLSALAGVLIVTAWRMNDWANIKFIFSHKFKSGMIKFLVTMAATVVLDLTQAIVIGVAVSVILILIKLTDIEINISEIDSERLEEAGIHLPRISGKVRVAVPYRCDILCGSRQAHEKAAGAGGSDRGADPVDERSSGHRPFRYTGNDRSCKGARGTRYRSISDECAA